VSQIPPIATDASPAAPFYQAQPIVVSTSRQMLHPAAASEHGGTVPPQTFPRYSSLPSELRTQVRTEAAKDLSLRGLSRLRATSREFRHDSALVDSLVERVSGQILSSEDIGQCCFSVQEVANLIPADRRGELLQQAAGELTGTEVIYDIEPVLLRYLLLRSNMALDQLQRADLGGIENGAAFSSVEHAAEAGVPHGQMVALWGAEELNPDAEDIANKAAAALAIITDSTAQQVAEVQGINNPERIHDIQQILLQSICVARREAGEDCVSIAARYGVEPEDVKRQSWPVEVSEQAAQGFEDRGPPGLFPLGEIKRVYTRTARAALAAETVSTVARDLDVWHSASHYLLGRIAAEVRPVSGIRRAELGSNQGGTA
jgi:hypothetical protein